MVDIVHRSVAARMFLVRRVILSNRAVFVVNSFMLESLRLDHCALCFVFLWCCESAFSWSWLVVSSSKTLSLCSVKATSRLPTYVPKMTHGRFQFLLLFQRKWRTSSHPVSVDRMCFRCREATSISAVTPSPGSLTS